uniref:Ycf21 n=1 Tax=Bostrychia simpliciuscula TaxID=324754 RepID=A0A1Z1M7T7_9FLOR|nr:hypothetical protein [Bostrychia simpliciuscula]ARW62030.1 hypothetical protein [Bostrychia simpliciuscula]
MYTFYKFHPICIIPIYKIKCLNNKFNSFFPNQWQLILMNEGSLTKSLSNLTSKIIQTNLLQKEYKKYQVVKRNIRCVWLETSIYTKLIFARSLWILIYNNKIYKIINTNKPIGFSLIENKIDTYKQIHEIYYGYCQKLEKNFTLKTAIWGRKYTLHYSNKSSTIIQEFFSPYIKKFFTK